MKLYFVVRVNCFPLKNYQKEQMAALYNIKSYDGKDRVLEICYTDLGKTYQIVLNEKGSEVLTDTKLKYTTKIDTPWDIWQAIAQNEIRGDEALAKQLYRVSGDFSLMINWDKFFGSKQENLHTDNISQSEKNMKKPPVMTTILIAWITFWVAVSIHTEIGAFITLGVCACYVKYNYNGEDALKNPIFMKTNYILAIAWESLQDGFKTGIRHGLPVENIREIYFSPNHNSLGIRSMTDFSCFCNRNIGSCIHLY